MRVRILLVVDSVPLRTRLKDLLEHDEGITLDFVSADEMWRRLTRQDADLILIEHSLLPSSPEPWIASLRALPERPEVVVLWRREVGQKRMALLAAGCLAVLSQELRDEQFLEALRALVERRRREDLRRLQAEGRHASYRLTDFSSSSPAMREFVRLAARVARSDNPLLIQGEAGVGKERLARAIHREGVRSGFPFIVVDCSLPTALLESELFGHEQGAFTGATRQRRGVFELAHGGTVFLNEIARVPLPLQVKLQRALEDQAIQRQGGERSRDINVRFMAATEYDLNAEASKKTFRRELYLRIAVVTLQLPPLRDRKEDIPLLANNYINHFSRVLQKGIKGIQPDAVAAMVQYSWPGNVRELINVTERAVLLAPQSKIRVHDLPRAISSTYLVAMEAQSPGDESEFRINMESLKDLPLRQARSQVVTEFERAYLAGLLSSSRGRIGKAASRAGIHVRTLYQLLKRHRLRKERFKSDRIDRQ